MERWLPVVGWEDVYEVSDWGRVRRIVGGTSTYAGRILSPITGAWGYPMVRFRFKGRESKPMIHCVVAAAFLGPRPHAHHVNHKDGDRANAKLSNLEYVTCSENHFHAYRILGRKGRQMFGETNTSAKLTGEQVSEIIRLYNAGGTTQKHLAGQYGVSQSNISQIVRGKKWTQLSA